MANPESLLPLLQASMRIDCIHQNMLRLCLTALPVAGHIHICFTLQRYICESPQCGFVTVVSWTAQRDCRLCCRPPFKRWRWTAQTSLSASSVDVLIHISNQ
ncbi:unnamed protein product [Ostreobium quekettii]|uniref:Uncharacterized protein n=1 Tax=Ostreobium quekettii TaxID=121088 RepID=A0A8S1JGI3_9CHLO|nr:unnamed protein product [Ostreobium quekettii]